MEDCLAIILTFTSSVVSNVIEYNPSYRDYDTGLRFLVGEWLVSVKKN